MAFNKILLSDNVTELTNVKSVVFKEAVNADVNIRPGCVGSASIEVEVYGSQATAVSAGDVVYYYQIDKNNVQTLIGEFICEPTIKTKTSYKFIAYDNAQKLNEDFSQWLQTNQSNFPMTVYALVSAACTVAGVTLGSSAWGLSTENVQAFYSDGITCRDILSYAAEIGCCFVRCHADGNVYFDFYSANANTIAPSVGTGQYAYKQDGLNYANFTTSTLDRVAVHPSGEDDVAYIYPTAITSGNTIHIQNNLLLTGADAALYNAVAQNVYTVMSALGTYRPMTASLFAKENPFRAGDIVSVTDAQSVAFTSIITGMTVSNSGAVLESTGNETYDEGTGNTQKAITQLASDVVRINKLKVDWADINQAIINYLTANNVTAQNLTIVDENGDVLATFNSTGITLGDIAETHAEIDFNSFKLYDRNGILYASIGDDRDSSGVGTVTETFNVTVPTPNFPCNGVTSDVSSVVVSVNDVVQTSGFTINNTPTLFVHFSSQKTVGDVVKISYETTDPVYQYALGTILYGSDMGVYSFATGKDASATGAYSSCIGGKTNLASGRNSFNVGGYENNATGDSGGNIGGFQNDSSGNHAITVGGRYNTASGFESVAVGGFRNVASGNGTVVLGQQNIARCQSQFVFGEYNEQDPNYTQDGVRGKYIEIVGNGGSPNIRSNARTLDWSGNETLSGGLTLGTPLAIADGGTGATTASAAKTNLGLDHLSTSYYSAANGSSVAVDLANGERGILLIAGSIQACKDAIIIACNNSGATTSTRILNASGLTVTNGTNKITIANSSGVYAFILKMTW